MRHRFEFLRFFFLSLLVMSLWPGEAVVVVVAAAIAIRFVLLTFVSWEF